NSEVKCCDADGSVGSPNVRVGHHQVFNLKRTPVTIVTGVFAFLYFLQHLQKNRLHEQDE
ncbi:hypothetical protein, partial [Lonepinella koalarum]|uniref:hypothetical protein n=1 Tax=Lonepinella koalarum TaxID=53417 RepID=UPI003F6DDCDF